MNKLIHRTLYLTGMVIQVGVVSIGVLCSRDYNQWFDNSTIGKSLYPILGLLYIYYFFCLIYSLLRIFSHRQKNKIKWLLIVLLIPIIGVFIYYERNIFIIPKTREELDKDKLEILLSKSIQTDNFQIQLMRRRSLAFIIDYGLYVLVCGIYIYKMGKSTPSGFVMEGGWYSLVPPVLWFLWFPLPETLFGQTLGKKLMNIIVINRHCEKPDILESLKRHILDPIDISYFSYIPIFFRKKNTIPRRLGDYFAKTWVLTRPN